MEIHFTEKLTGLLVTYNPALTCILTGFLRLNDEEPHAPCYFLPSV